VHFIYAGNESQNSILLVGAFVHVDCYLVMLAANEVSLNFAHSTIDQACVQTVPAIGCSNAVELWKALPRERLHVLGTIASNSRLQWLSTISSNYRLSYLTANSSAFQSFSIESLYTRGRQATGDVDRPRRKWRLLAMSETLLFGACISEIVLKSKRGQKERKFAFHNYSVLIITGLVCVDV